MANEPRNSKNVRRVTKPGSLVLLAAQATTGVGNTYDLGGAFLNFSLVTFRATTGTGGGSTKPSVKIQGSLNPQSTSAKWYTIGAATRTITTTAGTLAALTSTAAVTAIRASINNFTTSSGANPDKVATTVIVAPYGV